MGATVVTFPSASLQLAVTPGDILYTCPTGTRARITKLTFLNTTAIQQTVGVHIVRSGGAIGVTNQVWIAVPVPLNTSAPRGVECFEAEGQVLNPGDFLRCFASLAASITPMGSVVEFT